MYNKVEGSNIDLVIIPIEYRVCIYFRTPVEACKSYWQRSFRAVSLYGRPTLEAMEVRVQIMWRVQRNVHKIAKKYSFNYLWNEFDDLSTLLMGLANSRTKTSSREAVTLVNMCRNVRNLNVQGLWPGFGISCEGSRGQIHASPAMSLVEINGPSTYSHSVKRPLNSVDQNYKLYIVYLDLGWRMIIILTS